MSNTIIKPWFLVNLEHEGNIVAQVLWGIVIEDGKGRWQSDSYVCTSNVIERLGDNFFRTLNSVYECRGAGEEVTLEAKAILELRDGFSPAEYLMMKNLQKRDSSPSSSFQPIIWKVQKQLDFVERGFTCELYVYLTHTVCIRKLSIFPAEIY